MAKQKNWLEKFGVAVIILCLLVIAESIWVVNNINKKLLGEKSEQEATEALVQPSEEKAAPRAKLYFRGPNVWTKGEEGEVEILMATLDDLSLQGVDLVIRYDPKKWKVVDISKGEAFDKLARSLVEPERRRLVISLPSLAEGGEKFSAGEEVKLAVLRLSPLQEGAVFDLDFIKGTKVVPIKGKADYTNGGYLPVERSQ